jgi:hypothetical protein
MSDTAGHKKTQRDRSPGFPFIPLQTAIDRLIALEAMFGRHPAPANKVGLAWKMKPDSSQAGQTLAALKSFGLVDYQGASTDRVAVITEDGRTYLRAQQDSVKREVLKRVALKPKEIEKYWQTWGADRPPTPVCLDQLVLRGGFTQGAADTFLRVYDATVSYAGLANSDKVEEEEEEFEGQDSNPPEINVGDLIQAEIGGSLVFPAPVRVRAIQLHEGKPWFYVDGSETAISLEHVRLEHKGGPAFVPPPLPFSDIRPEVKVGWKEERLIDDSGDETFITYKGEPSVERYEFIRDYLEFRINRLKK